MKINEKKINRVFGLAVFLISTTVYLMTVAPTLLFWDCGEFITTSYIMGVPHPPGAPFYLMLGRLFSMIPFAEDIGLRVNLISVFSSSFTVLFLYLISTMLIKKWRGSVKDIYDVYIIHGSSAIGALTFAFTYTFWFNAVEAEVYALSMFFTSIVLWLTLIWTENHEREDSSKYLLLIMLLVGLGTGVHLLNILTLPVSVFIIWQYDKRTAFITGLGVFFSILVLFAFPLNWKIYSLFVFLILTVIFNRMENNEDLSLMFIMPLLLILGYSTYIMIYVRAGLNPPINENDPSNWQRMQAFLNREQYGDEAQLKNAVMLFFGEPNRKYLESLEKLGVAAGSAGDPWKGHWTFFWKYQIVEMYIRYFNWQFIGMNVNKLNRIVTLDGLYAVPFLAGLWGAIHHFFRDRKKALALLGLFVIMSLGLVIYQNQDYMQPRERDYFYVGSFFIFSIWIGMCITSILEALKEESRFRKLILPAAIVGLILPILELNAHYYISDRSGNYAAWDYSHNILQTCEDNAILFTNGDNDTFPVWYLQEVEKIRKDVQIINLSLLNTGWYIRQLKEKMPEYIRYSEPQIKEYFDPHYMTSEGFMRRYWPEKKNLKMPGKDGDSIVEWQLGPTMNINVQGAAEGFIKIQDQMVLEITAMNARMGWKRPVYFAVTVGSSNFVGLDKYMRMDGLCFKLVDFETEREINPQVLYKRILGRYLPAYRNLDNPNVYYDGNIQRMLQNYRSAFLQLIMHFEENSVIQDPSEDGLKPDVSVNYSYSDFLKMSPDNKKRYLLAKMNQILPPSTIPYTNEMVLAEIAGMYADVDQKDKGKALINEFDIFGLSIKKRMRFLVYLSSRGYSDVTYDLIDDYFEDISKLSQNRSKYELYFELYAGFVKMDQDELTEKISENIISELLKIDDAALKNSLFKEYAVLVYQGGDKDRCIYVLDKYLTVNPEDTEALELLYQVYLLENDTVKQLETAKRYLEIVPQDKEFIGILEELGSGNGTE